MRLSKFFFRLVPVVTSLAGLLSSYAQEASASGEGSVDPLKAVWRSTLDMRFVAIPGTTILFSVWETRVKDWNAFLIAKKYPWSFEPYFKQDENHPVVGVNLQDAIAFCNWLTEKERSENKLTSAQSYRLPTPDEWDAAAGLAGARKELGASTQERVEDTMAYIWGLTWPPPPKAANYAENEIDGYTDGYDFTAPVGQFTPTTEGLFDMAGNVWEWTDKPEMKSIPTGTLRGGSWAYFRRESLTSSYRYVVPADMRMPTIGFRCVFDDKHRTATLLNQVAASRQKSIDDRLQEMRGKTDMDKDIEALRQKMAGISAGAGDYLPDVSKLTAAESGKSYMNTLAMRLVPLASESRVLISTTETAVRDYEAYLKESRAAWKKPSHLLGDTQAAANMSWDDAKAFCQWLTEKERKLSLLDAKATYRLPTDVEWSLAAGLKEETGADPAERHLGNKEHFPWPTKSPEDWSPPVMSVNLDSVGGRIKGFSDTYPYTAPVDKSTPNEIGLREMGGNVAEWCEDAWPGTPDARVIRGGSYLGFERDHLLTSAREHAAKANTRNDLGFRIVIDLGSN